MKPSIPPDALRTRVRMPPPSRARRYGLALGVLLAGALAGWLLKDKLSATPTTMYLTTRATIGDLEATILASGTLKPVRLVAIGAQVSGRVTRVAVSVGQDVKQGDLIAEIDSISQKNSLRSYEAALESVRAQRAEKQATLTYAKATLARHEATLAQRASSRADYESAQATVDATLAQIANLDAQIVQAQVAVETARVNLAYTRITAPIDGTVLAVVTQEGQTVNAVQSAPTIVVVGNIDVMSIRAEISEADVVKVAAGQSVYFTILGDREHRYEALLESIEPAPESIKNDSSISSTTTGSSTSTSSSSSSSSAIYYNGIFKVPNVDRRLRSYMTAEVHIVVGKVTNALIIPVAALSSMEGDGLHTVQVLAPDGSVVAKKVKVGLNNKLAVEVIDGLRRDDNVVLGQASAKTTPSRLPSGPPGF